MSIINLGTYPPKQCGIAHFSSDLRHSLENRQQVLIAAVSDQEYKYKYGSEVVININQQTRQDYIRAATYINQSNSIDLVVIQHEYGIYGGVDGEYILDFVKILHKPYIIITHTVLPRPLEHQKNILQTLCRYSSAVVCMTNNSALLLQDIYGIQAQKINIIGHGVPEFRPQPSSLLKQKYHLTDKQVISTFGLIGPGKGLELGIEAIGKLTADYKDIIFLILGQTHPMLQRQEGERYREMLIAKVEELNIYDQVIFVNHHLSDEELGEYLYLTDIYLSPYPNMEQAVSGTLTFAVGCGRAIVSTPYAHARELLADNRGLLSAGPDPEQLATLMRSILDDPELKETLQRNAYAIGKTMTWPQTGVRYDNLIKNLLQDYQVESEKVNYAGLQALN